MSAGSQQKLSSHAKTERYAENGAWDFFQKPQPLLYAQTSYLNATLALGQGGIQGREPWRSAWAELHVKERLHRSKL